MKFEMYKDDAGEWRWRLVVANRRSLAESSKGYVRKRDCKNAILLIQVHAPDIPIVDVG